MNEQKTILIIEDDEVLVDMYKDKLKKEKFRVLTAKDGRVALQRVKDGADLILLDILMPGLNGFEVLKRIKNDDGTKEIPVIVLTNVGSESVDSDREFSLSLGAADYMIKSLNTPEDVLKRVKKILAI